MDEEQAVVFDPQNQEVQFRIPNRNESPPITDSSSDPECPRTMDKESSPLMTDKLGSTAFRDKPGKEESKPNEKTIGSFNIEQGL